MSMSIGSVGGYGSASMYSSQRAQQRPDPSQIADTLFSKLDTENKGYLEVSDLETAFANLDSSSDTSAGDVFGQLDGDSDGKITKEELTSGLKSLAEELDSQFSAMRMGGMQGMPPPPPRGEGEDQGLTQDELTSIAENSDDSRLSAMMSELASNFETADSDSDGLLTRDEAMAYQEASGTTSAESGGRPERGGGMPPPPPAGGEGQSSGDYDEADSNQDGTVSASERLAYLAENGSSETESDSSSNSTSNEAAVMRQIMELMRAYGEQSGTSAVSSLSVTA